MKKLSIYLFVVVAVTLLTACGNDDEPVNKQTFTSTLNCRAISGDEFVFSQGSADVELDYTNMMINFTAKYTDINGHSTTLMTPKMKLKNVAPTVYEFTGSSSQQVGSGIAESLGGYIDFGTGMMWFTVNNGSSEVVCSTQILYAYSTTTITNPDNGNHGSQEQSTYLFALDSRGETCILQIDYFMSNLNGTVDAPRIQYNGLTVTPTITGYKVTADEVESSYKGFYTLTDVDFILDEQCMVINGSYKCNGLEYQVTGPLFPIKKSN